MKVRSCFSKPQNCSSSLEYTCSALLNIWYSSPFGTWAKIDVNAMTAMIVLKPQTAIRSGERPNSIWVLFTVRFPTLKVKRNSAECGYVTSTGIFSSSPTRLPFSSVVRTHSCPWLCIRSRTCLRGCWATWLGCKNLICSVSEDRSTKMHTNQIPWYGLHRGASPVISQMTLCSKKSVLNMAYSVVGNDGG